MSEQRARIPTDRSAGGRFTRATAKLPLGKIVVVVSLLIPLGAVAALAGGSPLKQLPLTGGGAWLASPAQGLVTLIDGPSERVVGSVRAAGAGSGDSLSVVQAGSSAYAIDGTNGSVSYIDGATYDQTAPVGFTEPGSVPVVWRSEAIRPAAEGTAAGQHDVYVIDTARGIANVVQPKSLAVREQLALSARPGTDQSLVDAEGRLWVVDGNRGGITWLQAGDKGVAPETVDSRARLVLVKGAAVVVDPARQRVGPVDSGGNVSWSCLDAPADEGLQFLGSTTDDVVYIAAPSSGTLLRADLGSGECRDVRRISTPGDVLGPITQNGNYLFIPDRTTGTAVVVDTGPLKVVANLKIAKPGSTLELVSHNSYVFYNDLASELAGVLRLDGSGVWQAGKALEKFDRAAGDDLLIAAKDTGLQNPAVRSPEAAPATPTDTPSPPSDQDTGAPPPDIPTDRRTRPPTTTTAPPNPNPNDGGSPPPGTRRPTPNPTTLPAPSTTTQAPALPPSIEGLAASNVDVSPDAPNTKVTATVLNAAGARWTLTVHDDGCGFSTKVGGGKIPSGASSKRVAATVRLYDFTGGSCEDAEGTRTFLLEVTGKNGAAQASTDVQFAGFIGAEDCELERVGSGSLDLRDAGATDVLQVRSTGCMEATAVTFASSWVGTIDRPESLQPDEVVGITVTASSDPPSDGTNADAITVSLANGSKIKVDVRGTLPGVVASGSRNIKQTFQEDFDGGGADDVWFHAVTETERYFEGVNGATVTTVGDSQYMTCRDASPSASRIDLDSLPAGSHLCMRTSAGHLSSVLITSPAGPSPGVLGISFKTWE